MPSKRSLSSPMDAFVVILLLIALTGEVYSSTQSAPCLCIGRWLNCSGCGSWDDVFNVTCPLHRVEVLHVTDTELTTIDPRVCTLTALRVLYLSGNEISKLTNLTCLGNTLFALELDSNNLELFNFSDVRGLSQLAYLSVANNSIELVDFGSNDTTEAIGILRSLTSLEELDLSWNRLTVLDLFPFVFEKIGLVNASHNAITKFVNKLKIDVRDKTYLKGSFVADFDYNEFTTLSIRDLTEFGFDMASKAAIPIWQNYCFHIAKNPWSCGCSGRNLLDALSKNIKGSFGSNECLGRLLHEAHCATPEKHKGKSVVAISEEEKDYECLLFEGCPKTVYGDELCVCKKASNDSSLVHVDCSRRNLTTIPDPKLEQYILEVNLDENPIEVLEWRSFMEHTRTLTLNDGRIEHIFDSFWSGLSNSTMTTLSFRNSSIKNISQSIEDYDYPVEHLDLSGNSYQCDCDFVLWFERWLKNDTVREKMKNSKMPVCSDSGITIDNWSTNSIVWRCKIPLIALLSSAFLLLCACVVTSYIFREELRVLMYRYFGLCCHPRAKDYEVRKDPMDKADDNQNNRGRGHFKYDVYIFCADNDLRWARDNILDYLEGRAAEECPYNYAVGFQERNFLGGLYQADNITNAVEHSRRYLFVVSGSMLRSLDCRNAFERADHVALKEGRNVMIFVEREKLTREQRAREPEISAYLGNCLKPTDALYHEKLCYRMPPKKKELRDDGGDIQIIF